MKTIYTWLTLVGLLTVVGIGAALVDTKKAESGLTITAPDGFAVACATNYTRISPHICITNNNNAYASPTFDGTCRALSAMVGTVNAIPSNATMLIIAGDLRTVSANAIATRVIQATFFSNNTCTAAAFSIPDMKLEAREWVALAAAEYARISGYEILVTKTVGQTDAWYIGTLTSCVGCGGGFQVRGYYD